MIYEPPFEHMIIDDQEVKIDWLMYCSYEHNRKKSPHIPPQEWKKIYVNQEVYEKIYQNLKNKRKTYVNQQPLSSHSHTE